MVKVTLELLLERGLDLETAHVLMELMQLHAYHDEYVSKEGLEILIKAFKKDKQ